MRGSFSPRLLLLVLAVLSLISSLFIGLVLPIFYVQTFVYDSLAIVLYPDGLNYRLVFAACLILFIGFIIPVIKQNKFTYSLLTIFVVGGHFVFYLSILSYTYIGKEQIVLKKFFEEKTLKWSEIDEVVLEYYFDEYGTNEEYIFTSFEGESIRIPLIDKLIHEEKSKIYRVAQENNVQFIEREKK